MNARCKKILASGGDHFARKRHSREAINVSIDSLKARYSHALRTVGESARFCNMAGTDVEPSYARNLN